MVKKYVYGKPFETYAVICDENIVMASEQDKNALFAIAEAGKALEPYGGISWDRPDDGSEGVAMKYSHTMEPDDPAYTAIRLQGFSCQVFSDTPIHHL